MSVVIVPSPADDTFAELARTRSGRLFRKHILNMGPLRHPVTGETILVDEEFVRHLRENFDAGICDIVQLPLAGPRNEHTEAPDRNLGEVVGIDVHDGKVYATLDARKNADDFGKTLLGASAMMSTDYTDVKSGKRVGPTLLHVCVTNRPYVTGLDDYEELVAASAEETGEVVVLTPSVVEDQKEEIMDLAELLEILRDEHGIDVTELQAQAGLASKSSGAAELTAALSSVLSGTGVLKLSNGSEASADDIVGAVKELADDNSALAGRVGTLELTNAEQEIDGYVSEGRILPFQRDTMLELRMTNTDMFQSLLSEKPLVHLSAEAGVTPVDLKPDVDVDAMIKKYTEQAKEQGYVR